MGGGLVMDNLTKRYRRTRIVGGGGERRRRNAEKQEGKDHEKRHVDSRCYTVFKARFDEVGLGTLCTARQITM